MLVQANPNSPKRSVVILKKRGSSQSQPQQ